MKQVRTKSMFIDNHQQTMFFFQSLCGNVIFKQPQPYFDRFLAHNEDISTKVLEHAVPTSDSAIKITTLREWKQ